MADKKAPKIAEEPEVAAEQGGSTPLLDYTYEVNDHVVPEPVAEPK